MLVRTICNEKTVDIIKRIDILSFWNSEEERCSATMVVAATMLFLITQSSVLVLVASEDICMPHTIGILVFKASFSFSFLLPLLQYTSILHHTSLYAATTLDVFYTSHTLYIQRPFRHLI